MGVKRDAHAPPMPSLNVENHSSPLFLVLSLRYGVAGLKVYAATGRSGCAVHVLAMSCGRGASGLGLGCGCFVA